MQRKLKHRYARPWRNYIIHGVSITICERMSAATEVAATMGIIDHYRKLLYFALLEVRGELWGHGDELMAYYAHIIMDEVRDYVSVREKKILDVGGSDGGYCRVFSAGYGAKPVNLEPRAQRFVWPCTVRGVAQALPFADN
jgi:hypothetical protein